MFLFEREFYNNAAGNPLLIEIVVVQRIVLCKRTVWLNKKLGSVRCVGHAKYQYFSNPVFSSFHNMTEREDFIKFSVFIVALSQDSKFKSINL